MKKLESAPIVQHVNRDFILKKVTKVIHWWTHVVQSISVNFNYDFSDLDTNWTKELIKEDFQQIYLKC